MKRPSIRRDLAARCGLGIGLLLCVLSTGIYLIIQHSLYQELDRSIRQSAAFLANQVELENANIHFEWQEAIGTNKLLPDDALFQYWDESTGATTRSPKLANHDLVKFEGKDGAPELRDVILWNGDRARAMGMRIYPFIQHGEEGFATANIMTVRNRPHVLVVAGDGNPIRETLTRLRWILLGGTLLALTFVVLMVDWVVKASLLPINELARQVDLRTGQRFHEPLLVSSDLPQELAGLANDFNSLLARVSSIRERERDFIRHAAHELRTPIAGLRAITDLALFKKRDALVYAEYLESCRKSAIDLGELVNRLSALAKTGTGSSLAIDQAIDFDALLDECLGDFSPSFEDRSLKLKRVSDRHVVRGDRASIRIILNNLLDNAASYAPMGGRVEVRCKSMNDRFEFSISNEMMNPPDDVSRLFEPLFRGKNRENEPTSHLGIGLTLSLDAARSMGGSLNATIPREGWIQFVLSLRL